MHEKGMKWSDGDTYLGETLWKHHTDRTCYRPADGTKSDKGFFERRGDTIYPASLFLPPHVYQGVPVYFVVKRDDSEEWGEYIEWLKRAFGSEWGGDTYKYYGYDENSSFGGTWGSSSSKLSQNNPVLFESPKEFMDLLNKNTMKTDNRFPFKISAEQAERIVIAACSSWKEKLADKWAKDILLTRSIEIPEAFYKEMRGACTVEQHKLFDEIFGKDIEDKNAFSAIFANPLLKDMSQKLFGNECALEIGTFGVEPIRREDLRGRSLFVHQNYNVVLHKVPTSGGTIIEITKK
jgi:hypothetical protein